MSPKISCIVLSYNYGHYLPRCLDSLLSQPYPSLEIIVVDDGSTDNTPEVVQPYLEHGIIYLRKPNGGVVSAVNAGMEEATGEFLTIISADDEACSDRFTAQVDHLLAHPQTALVYSDMEVIDPDSHLLHSSFLRMSGLEHPSGRLLDRLYRSNVVSGGSMMVRAALKDRWHPIPGLFSCEDWWIAVCVAAEHDIDFVPGTVIRYRYHNSNMNLGRANRSSLLRDDLEFRRIILARPEAEMVGPDVIVDCVRHLTTTAIESRLLVHVTDVDRARSAELEADARELVFRRRFDAALRTFARAQASDPTAQRKPLFDQIIQLHSAQTAGFNEAVETRERRVLAFASELIDNSKLLVEVAEAITGDNATLVCQVASEGELAGLAALAEALAPGVDMVAVSEDTTTLAACCDVLLSMYDRPGLFQLMPRADSAARLRLALAGIF